MLQGDRSRLLTSDGERKLPALQSSAPDELLSAVLYRVLDIDGVEPKQKRQFLEVRLSRRLERPDRRHLNDPSARRVRLRRCRGVFVCARRCERASTCSARAARRDRAITSAPVPRETETGRDAGSTRRSGSTMLDPWSCRRSSPARLRLWPDDEVRGGAGEAGWQGADGVAIAIDPTGITDGEIPDEPPNVH